AEDDYYMNLDEPYRAANRPLADVTELRLVRGVTAEIYERLAPFVVVLPVTTAVNVNTAPLEVLMSLGPGIDRGTAEILAGARDVQPFQTVDAFTGFPMLVGRPLLGDGLSTRSDWFALRMQAEAGASILSARALLARSGPEQVQIVARTQGFFDVD
ncbi:MAG: type II secretion system minor pseudopilin GspK, partial [Gammaproteobacteria bacterium]